MAEEMTQESKADFANRRGASSGELVQGATETDADYARRSGHSPVAETFPMRLTKAGHFMNGLQVPVGTIVELTAAQCVAFADKFEPVDQKTDAQVAAEEEALRTPHDITEKNQDAARSLQAIKDADANLAKATEDKETAEKAKSILDKRGPNPGAKLDSNDPRRSGPLGTSANQGRTEGLANQGRTEGLANQGQSRTMPGDGLTQHVGETQHGNETARVESKSGESTASKIESAGKK